MEAATLPPAEPRPASVRAWSWLQHGLKRARRAGWRVGDRMLCWRGVEAAARTLLDCHPARRPGLLRALGAHVGEGVSIQSPFIVQNPGADLSALSVGGGAYLGPGVLVDLRAPVSIGPRVAVSAKVALVTHMDVGPSRLAVPYPPVHGAITIEADAYLGAGATILHGVQIGEMAVVAAGAVVRASVPPRSLAGGVPAELLGAIRKPGPAA